MITKHIPLLHHLSNWLLTCLTLLLVSIGYSQSFKLSDTNITKGQLTNLYQIPFYFASDSIINNNHTQLDSIVHFLRANKFVKIEIGVHTHLRGKSEYNLQVSQKRADRIKEYLMKKGIDSKRIIATGFGESKPLYPENNATTNNQGKSCGNSKNGNRRVSILILSNS